MGGLAATILAPFAGLFGRKAIADDTLDLETIGEAAGTLKPIGPQEIRWEYRVECLRPDGSRVDFLCGAFPDLATASLNHGWKCKTYYGLINFGYRFEVQRRPVGEWMPIMGPTDEQILSDTYLSHPLLFPPDFLAAPTKS